MFDRASLKSNVRFVLSSIGSDLPSIHTDVGGYFQVNGWQIDCIVVAKNIIGDHEGSVLLAILVCAYHCFNRFGLYNHFGLGSEVVHLENSYWPLNEDIAQNQNYQNWEEDATFVAVVGLLTYSPELGVGKQVYRF